MRFQWLLFIAVATMLLPFMANSQGVQGTITDSKGQAIPFVSIYVPELQRGTTANLSGEYQLSLPEGTFDIQFQYLGYQTHRHRLSISDKTITLNLVLEPQSYSLPEVIVTASGEDPAYYIMRKAIGMSQYFQNQVSAFKAKVYLKGSGVPEKIPAIMRRQLRRDGYEEGKHLVIETISEIHYRLGEPMQTNVISMRSSGNISDAQPMQFVTLSLYDEIEGIISPLSRNAFTAYRFRLDGMFVENGRTINKISVIPRRKGHDLYSGTIFIREGSWNIHSVDLKIEQRLFSLEIRQVYQEIKPLVWMPVSYDFEGMVSAMGGRAVFNYLVSVNDYQIDLNPDIDHAFYADLLALAEEEAAQFGNLAAEIRPPEEVPEPVSERQQRVEELMAQHELSNRQMRELNRLVRMEANAKQERPSLEVKPRGTEIADSARLRPPEHWQQYRPVPLTLDELRSFDEPLPDSLAADTTKSWLSPLANEILFGDWNRRISDNWTLSHNGLLGMGTFRYNTVDGLLYQKRFRLAHDLPSRQRFVFHGNASYALARKAAAADANAYFLYHPIQRSWVRLHFGRQTSDFNGSYGINPLINSVNTLFNKQNYLKLFEMDFVRVTHQTDIVNGLLLSATLSYENRRQLENNSTFHITNFFGNDFTPNIPPPIADRPELTESHRAFVLSARLSWTPRHFYRINNGRKQMVRSKYPTFSLAWKEGLPGFAGSEAQFRLFEAHIRHGFSVKLIGSFNYELETGRFTNSDKLYFTDFKHFNTNPLWISANSNRSDMFRTLPFYGRSSDGSYARLHLRHEHSRILIKRLPFLANSLIRETLFFNTLHTSGNKPWYEFGYGVNQIFLMFNLEIVTGFEGSTHRSTGIRISIPIDGQVIQL